MLETLVIEEVLAFWVCRHSRKPWSKFINADNQHLVVPEVCKLEHFYRMKAFVVYWVCLYWCLCFVMIHESVSVTRSLVGSPCCFQLNYFKSYGQMLAISHDWIATKVMIMPPICFSLSDHCLSFGWSMTSTAGNGFQCNQSFRGKDFAWEHSSLFRSESLVQITTFEQAIIYIFTPIHLGAHEVVGKEWQLVTAVRSDTLWVTLIRLWSLTLIVFIFLLLELTKWLTFKSVIVEISLQAHRNV